jgi:hypothetical protein
MMIKNLPLGFEGSGSSSGAATKIPGKSGASHRFIERARIDANDRRRSW